SAEPHRGPLAPPTVPTSVRPARMRSWPGGELESASRAWTTASKPLVMLVPWSPSPIAASSWTRWSFSSRMTTSIPCIQVAIVAASMTLALIKLIARVMDARSEEHTSELQSRGHLVCRLLLEKKNNLQRRIDGVHRQRRELETI